MVSIKCVGALHSFPFSFPTFVLYSCYYINNYYMITDQIIDWSDLGQVADAMYEWEGPIAEQLELTRADVAAIKI